MNTININSARDAEQVRTDQARNTQRADATRERLRTEKAQETVEAEKKTDEVRLSERAEEANRLADRAQRFPEVRQDRVDALQSQLRSGSFNPSSEKIAAAMLKDEG